MDSSRRYGLLAGVACLILVPAMAGAASTGMAERVQGEATEPSLGARGKLTREVGEGDHVDTLPRELQGIEVDEKVGESVPLDTAFRNERGEQVTLADYVDGNLPIILTFNYTNCPLLCSVQLNALVQSMKKIPLDAGKQYQIITVSLDPGETPESAAASKAGYVAMFPEQERDRVRAGWHFLTGEERAVQALADAVGFRYRYLARTKEYVHPASLIFLSPRGIVTRYFHGIDYRPEQLNVSIFKAGAGEFGVSAGFLLACFHYDPEAGSYARTGERIMRYSALGFVFLMVAGFGAWQLARSRRTRQGVS